MKGMAIFVVVVFPVFLLLDTRSHSCHVDGLHFCSFLLLFKSFGGFGIIIRKLDGEVYPPLKYYFITYLHHILA
jgi:hypothetical protein